MPFGTAGILPAPLPLLTQSDPNTAAAATAATAAALRQGAHCAADFVIHALTSQRFASPAPCQDCIRNGTVPVQEGV